jgi:hypothetical protein
MMGFKFNPASRMLLSTAERYFIHGYISRLNPALYQYINLHHCRALRPIRFGDLLLLSAQDPSRQNESVQYEHVPCPIMLIQIAH